MGKYWIDKFLDQRERERGEQKVIASLGDHARSVAPVMFENLRKAMEEEISRYKTRTGDDSIGFVSEHEQTFKLGRSQKFPTFTLKADLNNDGVITFSRSHQEQHHRT